MDLYLADHQAIVMGGSAGLGAGIAQSLAAEGTHVWLISRNEEKLQKTADYIQKKGGKASWIAADLSTLEGVKEAINIIKTKGIKPDIIIGNGGGPPPGEATTFNPQLWQQQAEAMLMPTMAMTDAFLPAMREKKFGRIIMVSSTSIIEPISGLVLSNAFRSALASWGKTLAREVAQDGITVNTIMPGSFDTDRIAQLNIAKAKKNNTSVDEIRHKKEKTIPVGRYGQPKEFGDIAAFIASPRASYITGAFIPVDGGLLNGH